MNRVLVAQAAAGLAAYLTEREEHPSVAIGYDGRKNSHVFATDTAEILAGAGVRAILLPRLLPTPVLAFAVRHLGTSAGIMVTASHNPPRDNGYKVYLGGDDAGSQIVPPADAEIAAHILRVAERDRVPDLRRGTFETAGEDVLDEYVRRAATVRRASGAAALRLHGHARRRLGDRAARVRRGRRHRGDPRGRADRTGRRVPTVAFPNPEEPGAMDLAFATAQRTDAEVIIANDPDADRLAVAIPDAAGTGSGSAATRSGPCSAGAPRNGCAGRPARHLAASIVSSPALREIARQFGFDYADTLTGFKWVSRVPNLAYGYEEALGYLVDPASLRDKDGISAAVDFLAIASELKAAGSTLQPAPTISRRRSAPSPPRKSPCGSRTPPSSPGSWGGFAPIRRAAWPAGMSRRPMISPPVSAVCRPATSSGSS